MSCSVTLQGRGAHTLVFIRHPNQGQVMTSIKFEGDASKMVLTSPITVPILSG